MALHLRSISTSCTDFHLTLEHANHRVVFDNGIGWMWLDESSHVETFDAMFVCLFFVCLLGAFGGAG